MKQQGSMDELPEAAQALLSPEAYPDNITRVELIQTEKSYIFLAGEFVYKVKKPVFLDYLDYTTLDKRQFYCRREIELNRRLCPDTYLDVVPINQNRDGIRVEGKGKAIEYAVKMRYLPREMMLDKLLIDDKVSEDMIAAIAEKITGFHQNAGTNATISFFGEQDGILTITEENFSRTIQYIGNTISQKSFRRIKDYTNAFIEANAYIFRKRVTDGKIKDCHGDIHATNICISDDVYIYDCIEYNDRFRYCDVVSDIAMLAVDLDYLGRADLAQSFVNAYTESSQDEELPKLINFYKCYRAYTRGRFEGLKLDNPDISEEEKEKTLEAAKKYFELAESCIEL